MIRKITALAFFILLSIPFTLTAKVIYVNGSYTGATEDGTTWTTPYKTIDTAIAKAAAGDEIWVAKGLYKSPTKTSLQGFHISKDLTIIGGFNGDETSIYLRDLENHKTIIEGDNSNGNTNPKIFSIDPNINVSMDGLNITKFQFAIFEHYDTLSGSANIQTGDRYKLKVNNCKFYEGGYPVQFGYFSNLEISNTEFNNTDRIYVDEHLKPGDSEVSNVLFQNCVIKNFFDKRFIIISIPAQVKVLGSTFLNNTNSGPLMIFEACNVEFSQCAFENNTGSSQLMIFMTCSVKFYQCAFEKNNLRLFSTSNDSKKVDIDRCLFKINSTSGTGLISIDDYDTEFSIRNSTFENNATRLVYSVASNIKILNSNFINNTNTNLGVSGGYMLILTPNYPNSNIEIEGSKFYNNKIEKGFIGLIGGDSLIFKLSESEFKNNEVADNNAAFLFYIGSIQMDNCLFEGNKNAQGSCIMINSGGSIGSSNSYINNSKFFNNNGLNEGIIKVTIPIGFANCTFINNQAQGGGALACYEATNINNCYFENNISLESGGGAVAAWYKTNISGSVFKNNISNGNDEGGGALWTRYGWFNIDNCLFKGNYSSKRSGGAIYMNTSQGGAPIATEIRNSTFVKNISNFGTSEWLSGEVISGKAKLISNCIFWGNGPKAPLTKYFEPGYLTYSNIQGGHPGTGNLDVDPKFVDFEGGDYRLSCASPLINKGSNQHATTTTDLDNKPRIFAGTVDMGAYEFPQDPTTVTAPPQVQFTVTSSACRAEQINFQNTTTPFENIRFEWNFGDGFSSQLANPTHSYTQAGTYTIILKATNACGASAQTSQTINILPTIAPTISYATLVCPGETTEFTTDASCSNLDWSVQGGAILSGHGTNKIRVLWGDGANGNGRVTLSATGCGSGFCESPVSIEIPIVPLNFELQGSAKVCQGTMAVYETKVKDATPSTLYTWSVIGGTITGARSGYNINKINVQWGSADTVGVVYLTTYNELLHCGKTDSFKVKLRPSFSINGDIQVCEGSSKTYTIVPAQDLGTFVWSVTGVNTVNNTTGEVTWGNISDSYYVIAEAQELDKVCNTFDSLEVELINNPQLYSVTGETEVDPNSVHVYTVDTDVSGLQFNWIATGGTVINKYGNNASITWNNNKPYQIGVSATVSGAGCTSNTVTLNVDTNFVYSITGPDTVCIGATADLTANTDPLNNTVYSWNSGLKSTQELDNVYKVTFDMPGTQIITLSATRNGKTYSAFKSVYVKAAVTDIAITGPKDIDPQGTGTYIYSIINSKNLQYDLDVIGAVNHTKNGNEVTVTWGGNEPFIITAQGVVPGDDCKGVPAKLEVKKVKILSDQINALGIPCLNTRVKYNFVIDEFTSNLEWSISGGGTIVSNNGNEIEVEWTSLGNYLINLQYERFGAKTSSLNVNVLSLPSPQINEATICGAAPLTLSTTSAYANYKWFLEPNPASFSTSAQPLVNSEGLYRVEVTGSNGCNNFTSKYIKQIPLPKVNIFTNDPTGYCLSSVAGTTKAISLKTYEGQDYQYQWYKDNQPIAGATTPVYTFNLPIDKASSSTYKVKVTLETCSETSKPISVSAYSCTGNGGNCTEPLVSFNVNSIDGCQPFTFENLSTEEGDFGWNFGDGTYSNEKNPSPKSYNDAGIFTVTLTRKCQSFKTNVEVPAVALFKLDAPGCKGQALKFNDLSVNIPGLSIESWLWDFGEGNTMPGSGAGDRDVTHIFSNTGNYLVKLTVNARNTQGKLCSHTFEKSINVTEPPVADYTTIAPPCTDNIYRFTDNSTSAYSTAKYLWNFGNGQTATLNDPSQKFSTGNYNVQLTVTDLLGCTDTKSTSINVSEPVAVGKITLTGDTILCNGKTVTLTSPAGNSYVWKKDGVVLGATTQSIFPAIAGSYTVTYNTSGCDVTTAPILLYEYQVDNLLSGNQKACVGDPLVINSNLDPSKYSFAWKLDTAYLPYNNAALIINDTKPTHAGNYYLTVTDKKNACMVTLPPYHIKVYDKPVKPVVNASPVQACYGGTVTLQSDIVKTGKTISWYKEQNLLTGTDSLITITNITSGANYTVKVTQDTTGCSIVSDKVFVNVGPDIQVHLSGDTNVCELSPIGIATGLNAIDYTFEWYRSGNVLQANGTKLSLANVALADSGIYYVKVTSTGTNNINGCTSYSDTLHLTVKSAPVKPVISGPSSFCSGSSITLGTNLTENYSWNTGAITNSINVTLGGVYSITSRNPVSGCEITSFANITENPLPDLSFFPEGVYERCASDKIVFEGLNQYPEFNWYVDGALFSSSNNLYPAKSGNYTLRVVSDSGCVAWSDTARITSLECPCYVTNTNDSGLGSLREAIDCANSKPGKDVIKFVIDGAGPFIIQPLTALPKIIDSVFIDGFSQSGSDVYDIILDGTNYSENALTIDYYIANNIISGLSFRNYKNAISLSTFVSNTDISKNIFNSISESAIKLNNNTQANSISENTIESSDLAIVLVSTSSQNTIEKNVITNSKIGIGVFQNSSENIISYNEITNSNENGVVVITGSQSNLIKANTIGNSTLNGIYINSKAKHNIIDSNFIGVNATGVNIVNGKNGIHVADTCDGVVIIRNVIGNNSEHGIYIQSKNVSISSNYIGTAKNGVAIANNKYGIYSEADSLWAYNNEIANNLEYGIYVAKGSSVLSNTINNNIKGGIYVQANGNKISRNTITNTNHLVKAIDLHMVPGPGGNDSKMPASFTKYRRSDNGVILKGTTLPNDTVEVFLNNNLTQQALKYAGSAKADASGVWELEIAQGPSFDPNKKNYFVNTATNSGNNTSELSDGFMIGCFSCVCTVTNTNDSGDGSFRAKVDSANTGSCLTINFGIPTPDSISLQSPITDILVPVSINGTQGGTDPLIKIKGNGAFNAFSIPSDGVYINHLTLSEFKNAVTVTGDYNRFDHVSIIKTDQPVKIAGNNNVFTSSGINSNLSHHVNFAADTLIYITGSNNQIGKLNEDNKIVNGQAYGVLVSAGKNNSILYNAIYDNKMAIAHVNNGNNLHPAPNTLAGSLLNGVASITGKAKENDRIQLFFSSYDPEQAFDYALEVYADASGNWNAIIPAGLFTPGQNNYFVATATDTIGNTSPLSAPVRIGDFIQVCYVTNTLNEGKGSLRDAVHCANVAGTGAQGVGAKIIFQLPETPNEILINSGYTITNNYGVQINPFQIPVAVKAQTPDFAGFTWATNNLQIKNLTFENFATALYCTGSNAIIDSNQFVNNQSGVVVNATGTAVNQTISNNNFAGGQSAILSRKGSLIIRKNSIGSKKDGADAVIQGFGIAVENCASLQMIENTIKNITTTTNPLIPAKYNGVPLYVRNASGTIVSNTMTGQGTTTAQNATLVNVNNAIVQNNKVSNAQTGIRIDSCSNIRFITNELSGITVKGFDLLTSDDILLSRNTVSGLLTGNKPIDLNLVQLSASNQSKVAPTIVTATYHDNKLHLIGTSEKNDLIELFYSDPQQSDLDTYVGSATTDTSGVWTIALDLNSDEAINYFFRATAKAFSANRTSEASNAYNPALKICLVTNDDNAGDGSLRDAIGRANANECNIIQFEIPQTGVVQIKPDNALPLITTSMLIVDATSQPGYSKANPVIDLVENSTQAYALSAIGSDQFFVYGLKVTGYDTALAMTNVSIAELNDNHIQGFDKAGISISAASFVYGNIINNKIVGANGDYGIYLDGTNNIIVDTNTIDEFDVAGIYSNAANQKLIKNILNAGNTASSIGIKLEEGNNGYVAKNVINKAYQGIVVDKGEKHYIFSNTLGTSDVDKVAAGEVVEESAIYVTNSNNPRIYYNTVNGTQNGIYVTGSHKPLVQNIIAKKVKNRVINIINCDSAEVVNNSLDSLKTGIYVSGSKHTYLNRNYIFEIAEHGILLDAGADSSILHANVIGADYLQSPRYSEGEGIHIKSSYNIVGGSKADTARNYVFHNKKGGIVVDGGIGNVVTYNYLFENDKSKGRPTALAIGLINNGNTNKGKPQIVDHKWQGDKLHILGTSSALNDSIHLYLGEGGYEEAREFMGLGATDNSGNWEVIVDTTALKKIKPQTTIYLTATATDVNKNTSPLSDIYIMGDCYVTSLKDTTDNEYPYPNSLRMAVNCANRQKQHVGIYFKIEEYGPKDIELQWKLQPLINPYGVTFNGRNLTTDNIPVGISGAKILPDDTVAWVISETQGPSVFDSLNVKKLKNGIQVLADSIHIRAFHFSEIESQALYAGANAHGLHVEDASFSQSPSATGIVLTEGSKHVFIEKSDFDEFKTSIKSEGSDSIRIRQNTFLASKSMDQTSVWLKEVEAVSLINNNFSSTMGGYKAVNWDNVKGEIRNNTFSSRNGKELVVIANTDSFTVANNNFTDSTDVYLGIQNSSNGNITGNTFTRPDRHSIQITGSSRLNIIANHVSAAPDDAFDLNSSDKIFISKNIIRNTRYNKAAKDSALCINIHKGDVALEANLGKLEPVNLKYAVKLGDDNRKGIFIQGKAEPGDSIEVFFSDSLSASMNKYLLKGVTNGAGLWEVKIPREEYYKDTISWYHCIAVAISPDSNTSQTSSVLHVPPQFDKFYVTNEYDAGPNSLRDALLQVNVSDLYSKVIFQIADPEFQPGPYRIEIDSLIDPVYSFLGFTMDGNTQKALGLGGDQRIIVEAGSIGDNYGLYLTDSSKSSKISNLWFNNANKGMWIDSEDNTIENLNFITESATTPKDSALVVTGNKNEIKGIYINNYRAGVTIKDAAGEITISESVIENVDTGILVADSAYDNSIEKIAIYNSYENGILVDSAADGNVFNQIHFGDNGKAIIGNAVKINNSESQSFINNMIAVLNPAANNDVSSGFLITGNSSFNYIYNNKINIDSSGAVHQSNIRGVTIIPSEDGSPSRNSVIANQMAGTGRAAIYARSTFGDLISENHIGVTEDALVSGIDSTGIFMSQCNNSEASDNIIRGYKVYGIELKQSDNIKMNRNIINSTFTNAKGININVGSPDVSNGGLIAPVITKGILIDTQTVRLRGTSTPGSTVEIFQSIKDTVQSIAFATNVTLTADPSGIWEADVNASFFSYSEDNCFVVQNHEGNRSSEFSNSFRLEPLLCQLAAISPSLKVIEPLYTPCPGPDFVLNPGLDSNLTFEWMSDRWEEPVKKRVLTLQDSATNLVLKVTDKFGCELIRNTEVLFKATPDYPDFIVSSNVYAGDTIVLVDVSLPIPSKYTWEVQEGVTIIGSGISDTLSSEDSVRYLSFILPDSGSYVIKQKSVRDGCFVELEKEILAGPKNPNDSVPYFVAPEIQTLTAYPNPGNGQNMKALVKTGTKEAVTLTLVNSQGSPMWEKELSGKESYEVRLPNIPAAGLYLLRLNTLTTEIVFKIFVEE